MLMIFFAGCVLLIVALIAMDLGVFHRQARVVSMREALIWSGIWIALALLFNVAVYALYGGNWMGFVDRYQPQLTGTRAASQFLTGYLLELSLSVDNLLVFATILRFFGIPLERQHRVLVWGIIGAIVLRGAMIGAGAALVARFDWVMYIFGVLLLWTAWKMYTSVDEAIEPERNIVLKLAKKMFPTTDQLHESRFFVRLDGVLHMTPMFLALILVDIIDIVFAIDSIPAIFGVTRPENDLFIIFTSNIFAVMGLRSMYFALINLIERFRYLKPAVVLLLAYIGLKMLLHGVVHIPDEVSLGVIVGTLAIGTVASLLAPPKPAAEGGHEPGNEVS